MNRVTTVPSLHVAVPRQLGSPAGAAHVAWGGANWGLAEWFVVSQTALPALLYLPGAQALRLPIRIAPFAVSLAILIWLRLTRAESTSPHPAQPWLIAVLALLGLMLFHPTTNSLTGGLAHIALYLCVMSPLFLAPELVLTPAHLRRLLVILLVCNGINAMIGVLQVYDPSTWLPGELSRLVTSSRYGLSPVSYIGPGGVRIVRPPGLFDNPGAVAGPGMFAVLLGAIFAASPIRLWQRAVSAGLALAGIAAISLSQVRISLVVMGVMLLAYLGVLVIQRRSARVLAFAGLIALIATAGLAAAVTLGGASVIVRMQTLLKDNPLMLYYASRGGQLVYTFTDLLFQSPFGAGLGRWGMTAAYFADTSNLDAPSIWAEIQLTGWMVDGGLVLVALYCLALLSTARYELGVARGGADEFVRASGAVVFAANLGIAALIFSFTPFASQVGLQYWFLAGALHGVVQHHRATT